MNLRLIGLAALIVFDLVVGLLTSLGLVAPLLAAGLLLANPLALVIAGRRRAGG